MPEARHLGPLKPADFHILMSLANSARHGYEIMKEVEAESGGTVRLEVGTLYRILARLLEDGLLAEAEADGRRRNYILTPFGLQALKEEAVRLAGVVERLRERKLLPRTGAS
jgi:DNA-binding PadR family transcriptional regulator